MAIQRGNGRCLAAVSTACLMRDIDDISCPYPSFKIVLGNRTESAFSSASIISTESFYCYLVIYWPHMSNAEISQIKESRSYSDVKKKNVAILFE
jgi:hypothetical protein